MRDILTLARIITRRGEKNIPLLDFGDGTSESNKEIQFFQGIQEGGIENDEQAIQNIYGKEPEGNRYKMLKSRLKNKLLNHLFFLNFKDDLLNIGHRYEQKCLNYLYFSRMLIKEGERKVSKRLLLKAIKLSEEAEFNYIVLECLKLLRTIYSMSGNYKLFASNKGKLDYYKKIVDDEEEAKNLYFSMKLTLDKSVISRRANLSETEETVKMLEDLWEKNKNYNIFELYFVLNLWYLELIGDFQKIIKIIEEIDLQYQKKLINPKRFNHNILIKYTIVYAHLRGRNNERGLELAQKHLGAFDKTTYNWFGFMENYFLLAMHARKYDLASRLLQQTFKNPYFEKINQSGKERWNLFKAYVYFVHPEKNIIKNFDYYEFMASVPEYSKDKRGFNVAILILQFLYYLKKRDFDALLFRIQSMSKYKDRYFRDHFSERSQLFFKLMRIVVSSELRRTKSARQGAKYIDRLQEVSPPGHAHAEIEIIPYEHLWDLILADLIA